VATVFLSYRHENDARRGRVRTLGEHLRDAGISVVLDQFYLDAHPGGPDEGWPAWSKRQAGETEKVLIIASAGWFRCLEVKRDAPRVGGIEDDDARERTHPGHVVEPLADGWKISRWRCRMYMISSTM
jgi:hypothetical protein